MPNERQFFTTGRRSGIMLAYPFEEKRLAKWRPPYVVQPKLDGERCRAVFDSYRRVTLYSSEENEILSVPHITKALEDLGLQSVELDGELYSHGMPLNEIHSIVSRKVDLHDSFEEINFHIFDVVNDSPTVVRQRQLLELPFGKPPLLHVSFRLCYTFEECMSQLDWAMQEGFEGIIVRELESPYVRRRSIWMMKFKPRRSDTYKIVGTKEEVSVDGTPKNRLGALICIAPGSTETFNVGTGFDAAAREHLWSIRSTLVGRQVMVKYQHLTSARGVPRSAVYDTLIEPVQHKEPQKCNLAEVMKKKHPERFA